MQLGTTLEDELRRYTRRSHVVFNLKAQVQAQFRRFDEKRMLAKANAPNNALVKESAKNLGRFVKQRVSDVTNRLDIESTRSKILLKRITRIFAAEDELGVYARMMALKQRRRANRRPRPRFEAHEAEINKVPFGDLNLDSMNKNLAGQEGVKSGLGPRLERMFLRVEALDSLAFPKGFGDKLLNLENRIQKSMANTPLTALADVETQPTDAQTALAKELSGHFTELFRMLDTKGVKGVNLGKIPRTRYWLVPEITHELLNAVRVKKMISKLADIRKSWLDAKEKDPDGTSMPPPDYLAMIKVQQLAKTDKFPYEWFVGDDTRLGGGQDKAYAWWTGYPTKLLDKHARMESMRRRRKLMN